MSTAANVHPASDAHWYYPDGRACYELPKKTGGGNKVPTLADARELGLVPSVTTILKTLNKPNLTAWIVEQAVLACVTTPRHPGEAVDAFIKRVMSDEKIQDQERDAAAQRGRAVHEAIANALMYQPYDKNLEIYVAPAVKEVRNLGRVIWVERNLAGEGYAGRGDALTENDRNITLIDIKTGKTIPKKEPWLEHRLQTSAYAKCLGNVADRHIVTANIYLSTTSPGQCAVFVQEDWTRTFEEGFRPLLNFWRFANNYNP